MWLKLKGVFIQKINNWLGQRFEHMVPEKDLFLEYNVCILLSVNIWLTSSAKHIEAEWKSIMIWWD